MYLKRFLLIFLMLFCGLRNKQEKLEIIQLCRKQGTQAKQVFGMGKGGCNRNFSKRGHKNNLWPLFAILLCLYWLCILKKRPKSTFCRHHPICTHSHIPAERVPWFYGLDLSQFSTLTATSIPYLWMEPEYQFKIRSWYHLP